MQDVYMPQVISTVRDLLGINVMGAGDGVWPASTRTLQNKIERKAGSFWPKVLYTHQLDLREYDLPGCTSVTFRFVDPMFVWIRCANALLEAKKGLHWKPKRHLHPSNMQVEGYGAGIQYGLLLRNATEDVPVGGRAALVNISWDGGGVGFGSRSAVPILIQVMNTNSSSVKGIGLLGYLPYVEVSEGVKEDVKFISAKKFVLQVTHCTPIARLRAREHAYDVHVYV